MPRRALTQFFQLFDGGYVFIDVVIIRVLHVLQRGKLHYGEQIALVATDNAGGTNLNESQKWDPICCGINIQRGKNNKNQIDSAAKFV